MTNPPDSPQDPTPSEPSPEGAAPEPPVGPGPLESSPADPASTTPAPEPAPEPEPAPPPPVYSAPPPPPVYTAPTGYTPPPPGYTPPPVSSAPPGYTPPPPGYSAPPVYTAPSIEVPASYGYAAPPPPPAPNSGYPVQLTIVPDLHESRLWGIPFIGQFVRFILLIPHFLVLWVLGFCVSVTYLIGWIPILLLGRVPGIQVSVLRETANRSARVAAYGFLLMPGGYPALEPGGKNPVEITIDVEGRTINRLWGIPLFGPLVRFLITIPHFIVLWLAWIVGFIGILPLFFAIMILGRYPGWAASLYCGLLRYQLRITAYLFLLPVPYPPFSFSN
jgi:Domain of unknown function (DUF4389)